MHQVYTPAIFNENALSCPKCNWKGCGEELNKEELFLTDAIELFCPKCEEYIGFVSTE